MSDLAVIAYKGEDTAEQVLNKVTGIGALSGATWGGWIGAVIGLLTLNPLFGFAAGAAVGAGAGALSDYGINDDFIKSLGKELEPDSSALFNEQETRLQKALQELQAVPA